MAIAFDSANASNTSAASSLTYSQTVVSATDGIIVVAAGSYTETVTHDGVTYAAAALTQIGTTVAFDDGFGGTPGRLSLWYKTGESTGANNVVITLSGTASVVIGGSSAWTGVDSGTPLGTSGTNSASSGGPTVNVTSTTDEVVVGAVLGLSDSAGEWATNIGADQTARFGSRHGGSGMAIHGSSEPGVSTTTFSYADAGYGWGIKAVPMKPAGGGGGAAPTETGGRMIDVYGTIGGSLSLVA